MKPGIKYPLSKKNLFFDCCIAKLIWQYVSKFLDLNLGIDFESVARFWLGNKKHLVTNAVSAAVLWSFWKFRNELCFQGRVWMGMKEVLYKIAKTLERWVPVMQQEAGDAIKKVVRALEQEASHHSTDVGQPGGFVIKVGSIGCSAYGLQRCNFESE